MSCHPVLIDGQWRPAVSSSSFNASNPQTGASLDESYPVSDWADCDAALEAATVAARQLRSMAPERIADFLEAFADEIEKRAEALVEMAHLETALPTSPRLADVELPRTTNQLRLAAAAAREGSWMAANIDTQAGLRSHFAPIGPVCVFGPNNFPFAFGSVSGGDAAAALAAGNPIIGKANSSHPGTTLLFGEAAIAAIEATDMPRATVQLLYRTSHSDGERLVADPRLGATGYTGSRGAGLKLKAAADAVGKPIYLELSSINPVVILPGALRERGDDIAQDFVVSGLMGTGQFCTNPGVTILLEGSESETFVEQVRSKYAEAPAGILLSKSVESSLTAGIETLVAAGANSLTSGTAAASGFSCPNTLLSVSGSEFLKAPETFQTEAFGNCSLIVVAQDVDEVVAIAASLEGNLTGCIYSDTQGSDDDAYDRIAPELRTKVGRLLNDKMPTGVAVSPAMNHGGPFPATGHPGFTAVGIPAAIHRFAALHSYDGVRPNRLPPALQDANPNGKMWRLVDGCWTQSDVSA